MLLPIGIWLGVLGYAAVKWGVDLWSGDPHTMAYELGLSGDPSPPAGSTSTFAPGSVGSAVGGVTGAAAAVVNKP